MMDILISSAPDVPLIQRPERVHSAAVLLRGRPAAHLRGEVGEAGNGVARLSLLQAILLQMFFLSILFACANLARADDALAGIDLSQVYYPISSLEATAPAWLQLASSVDEEKRALFAAPQRKIKSSWAFAFDNDLLAPGHRDRDYTYGINLTYSGADASDAAISLKLPLAFIDRSLGIENLPATSHNNYSVESGLFGFTPGDIEELQLNRSDRPYASLVYLSSSHEQIDNKNNIAWKTSLVIGALGLSLVGDLQNTAHKEISGEEARGWNHQISDGGELTARYVVARQHYLASFSDSVEMKSTLQASLGYLTETSWSLSIRDGKISSPWASFNPDLISYGEKSTYSSSIFSVNEHYFWAGVTLKARFYNAFLQGQLRHSDLTYSYAELRPIIAEGWLGYTYAFRQGYRVSYVLRAQTSEIKRGDGDRSVVWGGLIFAKTI